VKRQAIIFDFDGLILDTESPQAEVWRDLFSSAGVDFDLKVYNSIIGAFDSDVYRPEVELAKQFNDWRTPADILRYVELTQDALIMAKPLNPGVFEVLDEAKRRGIVVAVGSSSPQRWVQGHLERFGLFDRFETVVTSDDVNEPKPSPEIFELVLKRLDVKAEDTVVLEDSANGVMDFSLANEVLNSLLEFDLDKYF
jgi:HAD superfamily hydrolase (TIGR01509 family)